MKCLLKKKINVVLDRFPAVVVVLEKTRDS